jgi:hypothetical protein
MSTVQLFGYPRRRPIPRPAPIPPPMGAASGSDSPRVRRLRVPQNAQAISAKSNVATGARDRARPPRQAVDDAAQPVALAAHCRGNRARRRHRAPRRPRASCRARCGSDASDRRPHDRCLRRGRAASRPCLASAASWRLMRASRAESNDELDREVISDEARAKLRCWSVFVRPTSERALEPCHALRHGRSRSRRRFACAARARRKRER